MTANTATLTSTVAARFLRTGEVVTVGGFMRVTISDVDTNWGDGYVQILGTDVTGQIWAHLYAKDEMVEVIDVVAEDEAFRALLAAL